MRVNEFKKFVYEKFGIVFPKNIVFEEKKEGIRAFSKSLMSIDIKGKRGILVYTNKPTPSFARTFGHLAIKNRINISEEEARKIIKNKKIKMKNLVIGEYYIAFFNAQPVGVFFCDGSF
ncbi:MAG: hypothetical protein QXY05_03710 [Candidatus Anstonellales archaeon]